jgi:hypothetical protein
VGLPFSQANPTSPASARRKGDRTLSLHEERRFFMSERKGVIQYIQMVKEIASEPDYESVFSALKKLQ